MQEIVEAIITVWIALCIYKIGFKAGVRYEEAKKKRGA